MDTLRLLKPEDVSKPSRIFEVEPTDKCGGCNWPAYKLFVLAETQEVADELYRQGDAGLCGECFGELLVEVGYRVINPDIWELLGNAIDKLLDLEVAQLVKTLTDDEFAMLERYFVMIDK